MMFDDRRHATVNEKEKNNWASEDKQSRNSSDHFVAPVVSLDEPQVYPSPDSPIADPPSTSSASLVLARSHLIEFCIFKKSEEYEKTRRV